jgi:FkbM family methyltransferase
VEGSTIIHLKQILKMIYKIIPLKKELFSILKKVYIPKHHVYRHLYFNGIFKAKISNKRSFNIMHYGYMIENELFWAGIDGGHEKVSLGLWLKLCEHANCILDIGANTGIYSLVAKSINEKSKVYAYEPVERVLEKLEYNNQINGYDIHCSSYAISNKNGKAFFYDIPDEEHMTAVSVNYNPNTPETPVIKRDIETITLDTIVEKENIEQIDLIKIDVEFHSSEVIEGYLKYIEIHRPNIIIEILNDEIGRKVQALIQGMNYLYFNIDENLGVRKVDKILKSDTVNYLICSKEVAVNLGLIKDE